MGTGTRSDSNPTNVRFPIQCLSSLRHASVAPVAFVVCDAVLVQSADIAPGCVTLRLASCCVCALIGRRRRPRLRSPQWVNRSATSTRYGPLFPAAPLLGSAPLSPSAFAWLAGLHGWLQFACRFQLVFAVRFVWRVGLPVICLASHVVLSLLRGSLVRRAVSARAMVRLLLRRRLLPVRPARLRLLRLLRPLRLKSRYAPPCSLRVSFHIPLCAPIACDVRDCA